MCHYLLGASFYLIIDHEPIKWLKEMKNSNPHIILGCLPFIYNPNLIHRTNFFSQDDGVIAEGGDRALRPILCEKICDRVCPGFVCYLLEVSVP